MEFTLIREMEWRRQGNSDRERERERTKREVYSEWGRDRYWGIDHLVSRRTSSTGGKPPACL